MRGLAILLAVLCLTEADCAATRSVIKVEWEGLHIAQADLNAKEMVRDSVEGWVTGKPQIDCSFVNSQWSRDMKTTCWQLNKTPDKEWYPYGTNLRFVHPIAIIPELIDVNIKSDQVHVDWGEKAKDISYVRTLSEFHVKELTPAQLDQTSNLYGLGDLSESHAFTPVEMTIGGEYALGLWRNLVGKLPSHDCYEGTARCAVVLNSKRAGEEALAYCAIINSPLGLGDPFSCATVAFVRSGKWYVYSYDSPAQSVPRGGFEETGCTIATDKSLDEIAPIFLSAMRNGKTNIDLREIKRTNDSITYGGKNLATDSKFYKGYFERSSAYYTISKIGGSNGTSAFDLLGGGPGVKIDGFFNMLISADPSKNSVDYREIRDSDIEWFQNQVFNIIKENVGNKISRQVVCVGVGL
jgi:hypothetical protein